MTACPVDGWIVPPRRVIAAMWAYLGDKSPMPKWPHRKRLGTLCAECGGLVLIISDLGRGRWDR